ncbi:MAG: type II toxin-antitoxin system VapC family toxin [Gemmatimonadaceae bacterium]
MSRAFVDTSFLAAVALGERTAHSLRRRLAAHDTLAAATLLEAELCSILRRESSVAESRVAPWLAGIEWVAPARPLSEEIARVLAAGYVRGADCFHLATALYFSPEPSDISFLTLDVQQGAVARALGFRR